MAVDCRKILFAGTALVALNMTAAPALAAPPATQPAGIGTVVIDSGTPSIIIDHDPKATPALYFDYYDGLATVNGDVNITGSIVTSYDGYGSVKFIGNSHVTGQVGSSSYSLRALAVANDGDVTFDKAVFSQGILVSGDYSTAAGSVTFNGDVTTGVLLFYGDGTVNLNADLTVTTYGVAFGGYNGVLNVGDGVTITGDIGDQSGSNAGTVTFKGNAVLDGDIGQINKYGISEVNFDGAAGKTVTITGVANALDFNINGKGAVDFKDDVRGDIHFTGDGSATFEGTYVYGGIDATTNGIGSATFTGASTYVYGDIGALKSLTFDGGDGATAYIDGNFTAANTTNLNYTSVHTTGDFTLGSGQTLQTVLVPGGNSGNLYAEGDVTISSASKLKIGFGDVYGLAVNDTFTIVDGSNAGAGGVATLTQPFNTALITMTQVADADSLIVKVTGIKTVSDIAQGHNNAVIAGLIDAAGDNGLLDMMASAPTVADANGMLSTLYPDMSSLVQASTMMHNERTQGLIEDRIASVRNGGMTGMAAGGASPGNRAWVEGYGTRVSQSKRAGVDGYDADTFGAAFGLDTAKLISDGLFGVAFNYGQTKSDGNGYAGIDSDIDTFGATVYASWNLAQGAFINGTLGYGYHQIDAAYHNLMGLGMNGYADYAASQYSAKALIGRDYLMGSTRLTPTFSTAWSHLSTESYKEVVPAAGTTFDISADNVDVLKLGIGLEAGWEFKQDSGSSFKPAIHAAYGYNAINGRIENTVNINLGTPATYTVQGAEPARSEFNVGAAFTYASTADWDLSATYDYTFKEDYDAHAGTMRGTLHF